MKSPRDPPPSELVSRFAPERRTPRTRHDGRKVCRIKRRNSRHIMISNVYVCTPLMVMIINKRAELISWLLKTEKKPNMEFYASNRDTVSMHLQISIRMV